MELTQVLEATVSPDTAQLQQALQFLEQAAQQNLPLFLRALAGELADVSKSAVARMAAGLQLKNFLTAKDPDMKLQHQQRWIALDVTVRVEIKTLVVQALGTETSKPMAAPQCVAYIASAELPSGQWPEIVSHLVVSVTNPQSTESLKTASLDALGYICEEIDSRFLVGHSNDILTAIIQGMRKEEPSIMVRRSATKALLNSLEFTKVNFEKETERHFIMQVVCEATQCQDLEVQVAALQNLVKIMSLYYQYMEAYMGPALFAITREAMKSPHDEIALQGIEFWSTVCDEEQDLALEAAEALEAGRPPENNSFHYVKGALQFLLPILLVTLTKQEEYDDEDDWNPCKASGVCLSLMARCTEDAILDPVMAFVNENLNNVDWKCRDAAVMALGSIMEGPDPDMLAPYLQPVVEKVIQLMMDESVVVRDTSAWTLGRVCEQVPMVVIRDEVLGKLLAALGSGLEGEPRVANNVCWAISSLAEAAYDAAATHDAEPPTYCLSSSFEVMITKLLNTTDRSDAGSNNLRTSAYEALMDLIKYSALDCYSLVQKTTLVIMERLGRVLQIDQGQVSGGDRQHLSDLESLLCATLQSLLRKLSHDDVQQISAPVMHAVITMLNVTNALPSGGVQEDAIMTVSVLVESIGENFLTYMDNFYPFLKTSLLKFSDPTVCLSAVGLVGDLCRALTSKMSPYCDNIMEIFVTALTHTEVHRSVKPPVLSAVGDIALAIGLEFKKYLDVVLAILLQASKLQVDKQDYDMMEYLNELREGCLEAYTGIVQGLKGDKEGIINPDVKLVLPHVGELMDFLNSIAMDEDRSETNTSCSVGLLGDLLEVFGAPLVPHVASRPAIQALLGEGRQSRDKKTRTVSLWTSKLLKSLQNEQAGSKGKGKGSVIQ